MTLVPFLIRKFRKNCAHVLTIHNIHDIIDND